MSVVRCATPKPSRGTRKREKARAKRQEAKVIKTVREAVLARDRHCVLMWLSMCGGELQWAHIGPNRRCHTRGQKPEQRHTTKGTAMLCRKHHDAYDAHEFDIQPQTPAGMDGPFAVIRRAA